MNSLKIKKSSILYCLAIFLIYIEAFICSLSTALFPEQYAFLLSYTGLALLFFLNRVYDKENKSKVIRKYFVLYMAVIVIIFAIFRGMFVSMDSKYYILRYISLYIAFFLSMRHEKWIDYFLKLSYIFAFLFILTTIWLYFDTASLYKYFANNLYPKALFGRYELKSITCGITDHYSHNGVMLGNAFVLFFSYYIVGEKKRKNLFFLLLTSVAMILCGKRALVVFPIVGIVVVLVIYDQVLVKGNKFVKYFLIFLLILAVLYYVSTVSPIFQEYLSRFQDMSVDDNILSRYAYWVTAFQQFLNKPILGIGWLNFRNFNLQNNDAHNIYIQILCESGIIGALAFLFFYIKNLVVGLKQLFRVTKNKNSISKRIQVSVVFSVAYQIYYLSYGLTGNPHTLLYSLMPYIAASAMVYCAKTQLDKIERNNLL